MADVFITRRGGHNAAVSGGSLYAALGVKYPEGSVCTCSMGGKTLKAGDSSGQAVFALPEAGIWTVQISDGVNSKMQAVEISGGGQCLNVTVSYELTLLDEENGLAEGCSFSARSILPAVDVSSYSTLEIAARRTWAAADYAIEIGLATAQDENPIYAEGFGSGETETKTIDLSGLSGELYLSVGNANSMEMNGNIIDVIHTGFTAEITRIVFR